MWLLDIGMLATGERIKGCMRVGRCERTILRTFEDHLYDIRTIYCIL